MFLGWVLDVSVNKEGIHLTVNIFDGDLETVEASSLLLGWAVGGGGREEQNEDGALSAWRGWRKRTFGRTYEGKDNQTASKEKRDSHGSRTGNWISFEKFKAKFSFTIPSEAAKKARTCETK